MPTIYCPIVGTNYRPIEAQVAANSLRAGDQLVLQPEPTNAYDAHAVQVFMAYRGADLFIGYVPKRANNKLVAQWLRDQPTKVKARFLDRDLIGIYMDDEEQMKEDLSSEPTSFIPDDEIPF